MYGHTYSESMDQPGKVANLARGQLNREINIPLSAFAPENLVSRQSRPASACSSPYFPPEFRGMWGVGQLTGIFNRE